jgi:membrane protein YqaA with SNARE-associated domain
MAAAGSAIGSSIVYVIGKSGGEAVLHKRMSAERIARMRQRFEEREFVTLMFASVLPPPAPFKLFLISAAAFQMGFARYLLSIFLGRIIRFTVLAVLVIRFGPQVAGWLSSALRNHLLLTLIVFCAGVAALWWVLAWRKRKKANSRKQ